MGEFAYAFFGDFKDNVLKEIPWGLLWVICGCLVPMCIFQYGLYLLVLLPIKVKEGQRGKLQVIGVSLHGKHFLPAVP